jgi:D-alanyl-D-alanine carboxypeptidase/D-alanyl-D-alanine-endopeptidase (penicillin-binding protein 4)
VPEQDEPMWPSADTDHTSRAQDRQVYDGGATAHLPVPKPGASSDGAGKTDELAVPTTTAQNQFRQNQNQREQRQSEEKTSWFQPVVPVSQPPASPPPPPPPMRQPPPARPEHRQSPPQRPAELRRLPKIPAAPHAVPMRIDPAGEYYPAEATTGADKDVRPTQKPAAPDADFEPVDPPKPPREPQDPAKPKPKRKRRGVLTGGLALLLVVAVGVVVALPQVSNRLELPWAPNKPKGPDPQPTAVSLALHGPDASAAAPTAAGVAQTLSGPAASPALGQLTGSVVDPATGTVLWDRNSGQPLTPASTTKLLTVAAALLVLDHGLQLSTKVVQGSQPGVVVLVGGGDPTLNSLPVGHSSIYPGSAHLDDLIAQVKKATGGAVTKVQLDVNAYSGPVTAPGWAGNDAPSTYAAPVVPVMLDGGRTDPTNDYSQRVANPATAVVQKLAQGLAAQVQPGTVTAPPGAKVLGEVKSAPLTELVNTLLQHSDNTLADAVARQTAIATGAPPSFAGAAKATMDVLTQNGFDLTGVTLNDGCGLSTLNKIPAKVLSEVLAVAAAPDGKDPRTAKLRPMLGGLPVAGGSGTLSTRYLDVASAKGKGWLRAKTGTLSGVNTLAGVVLDTDGRVLVFALMSSGSLPDPGRAALDAVAADLRTCGCR